MESDLGTKKRTMVEEAMTKARLRKCNNPKCGTLFFKVMRRCFCGVQRAPPKTCSPPDTLLDFPPSSSLPSLASTLSRPKGATK